MPTPYPADVRQFRMEVDGLPVSGMKVEARGSNGVVIALHGGGYGARYWHLNDGDEGSLLHLGARLGFDVIALDRPGYGASLDVAVDGFSLERQMDVMFRVIEGLAADAPVYLIGHSMGGILAVMMAADGRGRRLGGIDVAGVPLHYPPEMQAQLSRSLDPGGRNDGSHAPSSAALRHMFYGPDGTFDPALAALVDGKAIAPVAEVRDAAAAPSTMPPAMRKIRIPVQWTIAENEKSSHGGLEMLDVVLSHLAECPHAATFWQKGSGHNISVHHVRSAYHLRARLFLESRALTGA